jgi:hypothetical protein
LSLQQLAGTDCPYCKTAFPHHAAAAQQVSLVNQLMQQQAAQAPWGYQQPPPQVPFTGYGQPPPPPPNPYGGAQNPYGFGVPPNPYGMPQGNYVEQQITVAAKRSILIFVILGVFFALATAGGAVAFLMIGR